MILKSSKNKPKKTAAKPAKLRSIKSKFLWCTVLIFLMVGIVVSSISAYAIYSSTITSLKKTMTESAHLAAEGVSYKLETFDRILNEVAANQIILNKSSEKEKVDFLAKKTATYDEYGCTFFFADASAHVYGTSLDISDRDFFQAAMKGEHFLSSPLIRKDTGKMSFSYSVPVYSEANKLIGALYMMFDYESLYDVVENVSMGQTGDAYVINNAGETVLYYDRQIVIDKYNTAVEAASDPALKALAELEKKAASGETGFGHYEYGGKDKILAYAPISGTQGWSVLVTAERREFMSGMRTGIFLCVASFLLCALASIAVMIRLTRKIVTPVNNCVERIRKLAEGDLTSAVPDVHTNDETQLLADSTAVIVDRVHFIVEDLGIVLNKIGQGDFTGVSRDRSQYAGDFQALVHSMQQIMSLLSGTLKKISTSSEQVAAGSGQVSNGAQALSQGATEQASSIEELAATIVEISSQVNKTAENATVARERTEQAGSAVETSNHQMQDMIAAMNEISEKSTEIGKIIKTIEDIAFQTNILALNAAVEAARAGEAGKGFAVVADEVRNLASKSADASNNTAALIESAVASIEKGTKIAEHTAQSLVQVVENTTATMEIVDKIAEAADGQASSIAQVTQGIDQISGVVQTNSATAEESAAASEELSDQAQLLKDLVGQFKLREAGIAKAPVQESQPTQPTAPIMRREEKY